MCYDFAVFSFLRDFNGLFAITPTYSCKTGFSNWNNKIITILIVDDELQLEMKYFDA